MRKENKENKNSKKENKLLSLDILSANELQEIRGGRARSLIDGPVEGDSGATLK